MSRPVPRTPTATPTTTPAAWKSPTTKPAGPRPGPPRTGPGPTGRGSIHEGGNLGSRGMLARPTVSGGFRAFGVPAFAGRALARIIHGFVGRTEQLVILPELQSLAKR